MKTMHKNRARMLALATVAAATLAACGGGANLAGDPNTLLGFSDASPKSDLLGTPAPVALAATVVTPITADEFFNWAQTTYPALFKGASATLTLGIYKYRYYSDTQLFLAVTGDNALGVGPMTGFNPVALGTLSGFTCTVKPSACTGTTAAAVNACADPAAQSLPTGFTTKLVFEYTGAVTGTQTVESTVVGPEAFGGQSLIKVNAKTTGTSTVAGQTTTLDTDSNIYQKVGTSGLPNTVSVVTTVPVTLGAISLGRNETTVTYDPVFEDATFTLAEGKSITQSASSSSKTKSYSNFVVQNPSTTVTQTITFEATEKVSVAGKDYDACRYKTTDSSTNTVKTWYMVGKGVPVRTQTLDSKGAVTQTIELKSGTYNGKAL